MYDSIFTSLFEITSFFNRPKQDNVLLKKAGIELDTALFPILVRVGMRENIGIVELSEQLGRDHSTVSRQVAKLQQTRLIEIKSSVKDARVRELQVAKEGKRLLAKISKARRELMMEVLADWSEVELKELEGNLLRLVKSLPNGIEKK